MPARIARRERRAARAAASRISDTRVLCVLVVTMEGSALSVAHDTTERPVHDRLRSFPTRLPAAGEFVISRRLLDVSAMSVRLRES